MKMLTNYTLFLTIILGGVCTFTANEVVAQSQFADDSRTLGVHHFTLLDGVDSESFETFVREEFEPVIKNMFPGIELMIMKGERNAGPGEYVLVYDIQSLWIRDYYFPTTAEQSDAAAAAIAACGVKCSQIWDRFGEMAELTNWTDFVEVVN